MYFQNTFMVIAGTCIEISSGTGHYEMDGLYSHHCSNYKFINESM